MRISDWSSDVCSSDLPMQGTAADIIKKAMVAVDRWLTASGLDAKVILQVHDELVLEVREDLVDQVREEIRQHMSDADTMRSEDSRVGKVCVSTCRSW